MVKVKVKNLSKRFGNILAVNDLNLEISDREFMVLIGPTGCGKTTTLRLIAGLERQDQGEILIDNQPVDDVGAGRRGVQMVFQNFALWPHMRVMDEKKYANINFALKIRKWINRDIKDRAEEVARKIGIERRLFSRKPQELSEGQKQKVAIGRAVVIPPKVFLMDEPMSNIDPPAKVKLKEEIIKVHQELGTTTLYVTHNMTDAMTLADRIAVMKDGTIIQVDTPRNLYEHPVDDFVADFVKSADISYRLTLGK